jgi:hydrogenase small subunit
VLYVLTFKKLPDLDAQGRPKFAYRRLIHEGCERRAHFDAGRFVLQFGDDGHRRGWCLYKMGCKGPETFNNCPEQLFGDVGARTWPVGTGCPCFGCSEKGVGFTKPIPEQASLAHFTAAGLPLEEGKVRVGGGELRLTPPTAFAPIEAPEGHGATTAAVGLVAGLAGLAVGAGAVTAMKLGKDKSDPGAETKKD